MINLNRVWRTCCPIGLRRAVADDRQIRRQAERLGLKASRRRGLWVLMDEFEGEFATGLHDFQALYVLSKIAKPHSGRGRAA